MSWAADFVALALREVGMPYVYGRKWPDVADPAGGVDCSGFVHWACGRVGIDFPDGSWNQYNRCAQQGTLIDVDRAIGVQGALLFRGPKGADHVAISLGNGSTVEARGRAYGVGIFSADGGRHWSGAALIPGLDYSPPPPAPTVAPAPTPAPSPPVPAPPPPTDTGPPWPGRYLVNPPVTRGDDVRSWQQRMSDRGWRIEPDGDYGPASAGTCRSFQTEKNLRVDGIVGPDTWRATWAAPIT